MAKVGVGVCMEDVYYPECPYAKQGKYNVPDCLCELLSGDEGSGIYGEYWCSVANECGTCPFDLHKELYISENGE